MDEESTKKLQELQILEQNLQASVMQKQNIQLEKNEVENALEELSKTKDDVYKIVGGLMIKSDKESVKKDLEEKKKLIDAKMSSVDKQEKLIEEKAEELKKDLNSNLSKK